MTNRKLAQRESRRIVGRLKLYFATLTCLGGLVLAAGSDTESIPVIAVFFAVFGYVFVDWLKLFALPPIAAYAAMAVAAVYCVSDFADLDAPGNHQMVAVARLLVMVQAILMLQRKSRRIFEQLGVFCLLELIVAAVFNNAINYGLLLIPISVIGAWALSLLAALSASEGLEVMDDLEKEESANLFRGPPRSSSISVSAPDSVLSLASAALRLPRIAMLTLAPSVMLVGVIFFYALPRTTDAARVNNRSGALVGFDTEMDLEQIGQIMQSTQTALRIYMTDRPTRQTYTVVGGIYMRGRVLERYKPDIGGDRNSAKWTSVAPGSITGAQRIPNEYFPLRSTDQNFYDPVHVSVICESMRNDALFAIAPYHRVKNEPDVVHMTDRWTIARRASEEWTFPRTTYTFGTNAFRAGVQTELVARWAEGESFMASTNDVDLSRRAESSDAQREAESYIEELLVFDRDAMPTAEALAKRFVNTRDGNRRTDYDIARAMERFFASSAEYGYTLNLDAESVPGLDPIEQFLSIDKKGHCQYYASALAMMLRSQKIPARVVVGYHTDEFNELGQHYVARQLHAHSWVEALIEKDQLNINRNVYGQPPAQQYWVRLDPTPAGGRIRESGSGVGQMLDMAQNMWDDYVVDMDSAAQDNVLLGGGITPMSGSYEGLVDWLSLKISRIRAGELGGGSLALRDLFSWSAALATAVVSLIVVALLRFKLPAWIRRRIATTKAQRTARPSIAFYAETLDQLARAGVTRAPSQTPAELAATAARQLQHPMIPSISQPLDLLTATFYRLRFGGPQETGRGGLEISDPIKHARQRTPEVDAALSELTKSVDLMMVNSDAARKKL